MPPTIAMFLSGGCLVAALAVVLIVRASRGQSQQRIRESFRLHREQLEAKFFELASSQGKPRGLRWLECQWLETVLFGRDRTTGMITAFASVNIRFEAIEGGDMEDVAAVGAIRDAVALFHWQNHQWGTGGKVLFNHDPQLALQRYANQYAPL